MATQTQNPYLGWGGFLHKHSGAFAAFVAAVVLVAIGGVYVFVWFTGYAQTSGLVPSLLNLWSIANSVTFILHAIFWELVLIGIPAVIGALFGWQWWRLLPKEEKSQYNLSGKPSKSRGAGGAVSPLLFIAFAIKVYVDGNWNQAIASWNLDYVIGSMITILIWTTAIFAVPAIISLVWWVSREKKRIP